MISNRNHRQRAHMKAFHGIAIETGLHDAPIGIAAYLTDKEIVQIWVYERQWTDRIFPVLIHHKLQTYVFHLFGAYRANAFLKRLLSYLFTDKIQYGIKSKYAGNSKPQYESIFIKKSIAPADSSESTFWGVCSVFFISFDVFFVFQPLYIFISRPFINESVSGLL